MHKDFICYADLCDTLSTAYFQGKLLYHAAFELKVLSESATVAERIRFYRNKRYMKSDTLADSIGLSRYAVMRYESSETEPFLEDLKKIAVVLEIEPYMLYDDYYRFLDYPYSRRIKEIRTKNKLRQHQLGAMLGVTRRAIERWEHEKNVVTRERWEQLKELGLL